MSIQARRWLSAILLAVGLTWAPAARAEDDPLDTVKSRMQIEAQRIEKEYKDARVAAYKLVRRDDPKLLDATDKLTAVLTVVQKDRSLADSRRKVILVTLKWDLDKVAEIAAERRRATTRESDRLIAKDTRREITKSSTTRRTEDTRDTTRVASSILDGRGRTVADNRTDKTTKGDRFNRTLASVDKSAMPESRDYVLPKNWAELSKNRSTGAKMTLKERAIMTALDKTLDADFSKVTFGEVIETLTKKLGVTIVTDPKGLQEANISESETEVNLKLKASTRSVLRKLLATHNLAYIVKDETIWITSQELAKQETTTRTYYVGDLASVTDVRLPPLLTKLLMIQNIRTMINTITTTIEPKSWKVNDPDAVGTITFDPLTMSIIVKQTAEIHYSLRR